MFVMFVLLAALAVGLFVIRPAVFDRQRQNAEEELLRLIESGQMEIEAVSAPAVSGENSVFQELGLQDTCQTDEAFSVSGCGILSIPSIELKMPLASGTDSCVLRVAAGWYPESAEIGGAGNCVIIGHHLNRFGRHFNRLDELKKGDSITVQNRAGEAFDYIVTGSVVIKPEELLQRISEYDTGCNLTLVTDRGSGTGSHRLVIYAELDTSVG